MPHVEKKRLYLSLGINLLIVALECYVLTNAYYGYVKGSSGQGAMMFRFFTEDSNILLGFSSFLYLVFGLGSLKKKTMPETVKWLRLIAVSAISTTFFVVLLFLSPAVVIEYGQSYFMMFSWPNMTFTHLICPLLAIGSFIFLEEPLTTKQPFWKRSFWCLSTVGSYAVIVGSFSSIHLISSDERVNNVYGFMDATVCWWATLIAFISIFALTYGEGFLLQVFQKRRTSKKGKNTQS